MMRTVLALSFLLVSGATSGGARRSPRIYTIGDSLGLCNPTGNVGVQSGWVAQIRAICLNIPGTILHSWDVDTPASELPWFTSDHPYFGPRITPEGNPWSDLFVPFVDASGPDDVLVVSLGSNDSTLMAAGQMPDDFEDLFYWTFQQQQFIIVARELGFEQIVWLTFPQRSGLGRALWNYALAGVIMGSQGQGDAFTNVAVEYVDVRKGFDYDTMLGDDGVHLNPAGNDHYAQAIANHLGIQLATCPCPNNDPRVSLIPWSVSGMH